MINDFFYFLQFLLFVFGMFFIFQILFINSFIIILYILYCLFQGEVGKLQQHLSLLREQYVKLQQRHTALEQQYAIASASSSASSGEDCFVTRLLRFVASLYDKVCRMLD